MSGDNDKNKKGFSGLSDLASEVSEIDKPLESEIKAEETSSEPNQKLKVLQDKIIKEIRDQYRSSSDLHLMSFFGIKYESGSYVYNGVVYKNLEEALIVAYSSQKSQPPRNLDDVVEQKKTSSPPSSAAKELDEELLEQPEIKLTPKKKKTAISSEKRSQIPAHYPMFLSHLQRPGIRLIYSFFLAFSLLIGLILIFGGRPRPVQGLIALTLFALILFTILTFFHLVVFHYKPWRERSMMFRRYCFFFICWFVGFTFVVFMFDPFDYTYRWRDDEIMQYLAFSILVPSLIGIGLYSYERFVKASFSNN